MLPIKLIFHPWTFCIVFFLSIFQSSAQTSTIRKLQKQLPLSRDSISYVNTLNRIGMLMHLKNPDSCFIYAVKAKNIALRINYTKGQADADNNLAIALCLKGMQHDALKRFSKTLAAYKHLKDTANIAQVYTNMASAYSQLSDTVNAIKFCRKAIYTGKKIHNDSIMSVVYSNYCNTNPLLPEDSAQYYIARSQKIATKYKDSRMFFVNQLLKASRLLAGGQKEGALPIIRQALSDSHSAGLEYVEISALDLLATFYADKPEIAIGYYEDIYQIIDKKGYPYLKPAVLKAMLYYAELSGNKDKQVDIAKLLAIAVSEEQQFLNKFFGDYVHYNDLEVDNRLLEIMAQADRKRIGLLAIFSTLCLLLISLIFSLYKKSQKQSRKKTELNRIIRQKNKALEATDLFKNRLVSILAHDFRSPLISTMSLVEILKVNADLSEEEMANFYEIITSDISHMLERFDSTLQWIRQQLTGYKLNPITISLNTLFDEAAQNFKIDTQKKGLYLVNEIPVDTVIRCDKEMLQFINRNLLSNAIKFSPENSTITIKIVTDNNTLTISVSDQGRGLDANTLENLFSITATGGTTYQGAGIALSMCKDFIEKLGGQIWAENNADRGAVFYYTLPL